MMLDVAIRYQDQLVDEFRKIWFKEKYKFWNGTKYFQDWTPSDNTYEEHQFVSVNTLYNRVIGYVSYCINRFDGDIAYDLNIINFEAEPSMTFAMDLGRALTDIFEKYNFRKLNFYVIVGNPAEKAYDKMIKRYGGRIVGYRKENTRLFDGRYYDDKLYEVMRSDYFRKKETRKRIRERRSRLNAD